MRAAFFVLLLSVGVRAEEPDLDEPPRPAGFWAAPLDRLTLRFLAAAEYDRPYSVPPRPEDMAGGIALSCEYQQGRPCGDGAGAGVELDSAAGFGSVLSASTRVRLWGGSDSYGHNLELDRARLRFTYGPFEAQLGRDALQLGPAVRGALMVSNQAPPQDGLRLQLHPVALASWLKLSLLYFIDRLRDPQTFPGTLLDCTRAQLDFFDAVSLGGSRLLQIGGDGAPYYGGFSGWIWEHFGREAANTAGPENNRLSFDLAARWAFARAWYEIAFEDTRHRFWNMLAYDADHLVGVELQGLRAGPLRGAVVELTHTGWTSQTHSVFKTGMTNGGRTMGSALGPDAWSLWARADFSLLQARLSPWAEWLRFGSEHYGTDEARGVFITSVGPIEHRQRLGADAAAQLTGKWWASAGLFGERIANAAFTEGDSRWSAGAHLELIYAP